MTDMRHMTDRRIRRHRRRTVGTGFGLGLLLTAGVPGFATGGGLVQAQRPGDMSATVIVPVTTAGVDGPVVGFDTSVPASSRVQTRSDRAVRAARVARRARAERIRQDAAISQAIADRWASVPVPADPAAALALRARVLFDRADLGDDDAVDEYRTVRRRLAADIALRVGVSADLLLDAWRKAPIGHQRALMAALSQLGVPYRYLASREWQGFDCSGLTSFAWAQAGVMIPRSSGTQIAAAAPRTVDTAQAGDLVQYPGHVSMYLGVDNAIVHSPYSGRDVEVDRLTRTRVRYGDPTG